MKIVVDVPVEESILARLRAAGRHHFEEINPPAEVARALPVELIAGADVLFCSFPPTNHADMVAWHWVQLASTGVPLLRNWGLLLVGS